jgi:hypothetical protein
MAPCKQCNNLSPRGHVKSELFSGEHQLRLSIAFSQLQPNCVYCTLLGAVTQRFVLDPKSYSKEMSLELHLEDNSPTNLEVWTRNPQEVTGTTCALLHMYLPNNASSPIAR